MDMESQNPLIYNLHEGGNTDKFNIFPIDHMGHDHYGVSKINAFVKFGTIFRFHNFV